MSEAIKRCPFCAEEILADAKKCKHCGSLVDVDSPVLAAAKPLPLADYGVALLAAPVVATMLIWLWVGNMNLLQSPGSTMTLILAVVILVTAVVASMEAGKAGMASDRAEGTYSPIAWFFIIALLWIVGYPTYLYKRKHYGLANLSVWGALVALVFLGSWNIMNSAVEDKEAEVRGKIEQVQKNLESLGTSGFQLPDPSLSQTNPQSERTQSSEKPFLTICAPRVIPNAQKLGGMSDAEAVQHAKEVCADVEATYSACIKQGIGEAACLDKALPTGE